MALSEQQASKTNLMEFLATVAARGYHVGEHPKYGGVNDAVHRSGSWHGDGLAADINWRGSGSERTKLLELIPLAESYGLGITFARDGTAGSAASHQNHLHVDCGSWSNYGNGPVAARKAAPRPTTPSRRDWNMDRLDLRKATRRPVLGKHVGNLQGLLMAAGYGPRGLVAARTGRPDGIAGRATRAAVAKFQMKHGTGSADGKADYIVGDATWAALIEK